MCASFALDACRMLRMLVRHRASILAGVLAPRYEKCMTCICRRIYNNFSPWSCSRAGRSQEAADDDTAHQSTSSSFTVSINVTPPARTTSAADTATAAAVAATGAAANVFAPIIDWLPSEMTRRRRCQQLATSSYVVFFIARSLAPSLTRRIAG